MASQDSPPPPPNASPLKREFDTLIEQGLRSEDVLGERLLVLGQGPVPVKGSLGAAVCLDRSGILVLLIAVPILEGDAASDIADQLDRLAQMSEGELAELRTTSSDADIPAQHRDFFALDTADETPRLNHAQRVKVIVEARPSIAAWKSAVVEVGGQLDGLYLATEEGLEPIPPPADIQRRPTEATGWAPRHWFGLAGLLIGIGVILIALWRALDPVEPVIQTVEVGFSVQNVAVDAPPDATNTNWIGQGRVFKTNDGRLLFLYGTSDGIHIVQDQRNHGRTWRSPVVVGDLRPTSFSATLDASDNVHVAFVRGSDVGYAFIRATRTGWEVVAQTNLDTDGNEVVDVAWDEDTQRAHIVWARTTDPGQEARWASIAIQDETANITQTQVLAPAEGDVPVLMNVAASPSQVIATYRASGSPTGWFSRRATGAADQYEWTPQERLPTDAVVGAASLAHARGVSHLILRDGTDNQLLYFRRSRRAGWSTPQTVVEADSIDEIDFPVLSVDSASRLVYLFYQTNRLDPAPQIQMAVRDPAAGWQGPYQTAGVAEIPEGARYPATLHLLQGQPLVLWTSAGAAPAVQAARVIAP